MDETNPIVAAKTMEWTPAPDNPIEQAKDPLKSYVPEYLGRQLQQQRTWEEVAPALKELGADPEAYRQNYQLEEARAVQKGEGIGTMERWLGSSIPFGSAIRNWRDERKLGEATKAFQEGKATGEQIGFIARHERMAEIEKGMGTGASALAEVTKIPAILGEFSAGGSAVRGLGLVKGTGIGARAAAGALATPAVPSTYLAAGARNQAANPNESLFQSYAPPVAMAMAQNAVLGQLQGLFSGANITRVGRIGAKTVVGMGEAAAADVATTGLDRVTKEVTGKSLGLDTKWGTLGAVLRGDEGAGKQAAVQFLTFSVFSAMHSGREIPHEVFKKATEAAPEKVVEVGKQVMDGTFDPETPGPVGDLGREYADVVSSARARRERLTQPETPWKPSEATPEPPGQVPAEGEIVAPGASEAVAGPEKGPVQVGESRNVKHFSGADMQTRPIMDGGREIGKVDTIRRVTDEGVDLHIEHLGERNKAINEEGASLGVPVIREVFKTLLAEHPDVTRFTGLRTSGARAGLPKELQRTSIPAKVVKRWLGSEAPKIGGKTHVEVNAFRGVPERGSTVATDPRISFWTETAENAKVYAGEKGKVLNEKLVFKNPLRAEHWTDAKKKLGLPLATDMTALLDAARAAGHDGVIWKHHGKTEYVKFHEESAPSGPIEDTVKLIPVSLQPVMKRAGLTRAENEVLMARLNPEGEMPSFGELSKTIIGEGGKPVKRQRLQQLEQQALKKLEKVSGGKFSGSVADLRAAIGLDAIERGDTVSATDLHADPEQAKAVVKKRISARERNEAAMDRLADQFIKESEHGLSPEREAWFKAESARLAGLARSGKEGEPTEDRPAQVVPPKVGAAPPRQSRTEVLTNEWRSVAGKGLEAQGPIIKALKAHGWQLTPEAPKSKVSFDPAIHEDTFIESGSGNTAEIVQRGWTDPSGRLVVKPLVRRLAAMQDDLGVNRHWRKLQDEHERVQQAALDDFFAPEAAHGLTESEMMEAVADEVFDNPHGITAVKFDPNAAPSSPVTALKAVAGEKFTAVYTALKEKVAAGVKGIVDNWHELAGQIAPRIRRLSEASANALAKYIASPVYVERAMPVYFEKVLGPITGHEGTDLKGEGQQKDKDAVARRFMAALYEERFRHARTALTKEAKRLEAEARREVDEVKKRELYTAAADYMEKAGEVRTFIGRENAEMDTEADFQKTVGMKEYQAFKDRFRTEFVPLAEKFYRLAEGLEEDSAIESLTQLPGLPFTAKAIKPADAADPKSVVMGELPAFTGGPTRGRVTNVRQGRIGAARIFTGKAEGYDIDPKSVMENMLRDRVQKANKAQMYRTLVADGLAKWGPKREPAETEDGRRMEELPVEPPRGTQTGAGKDASLYVHPDAAKEVRNALGLDKPFLHVPGTGAATRVALLALVETATHLKNLGTFVFKPGVSPIDIGRNAWKILNGDAEVKAKLVDLAEMGAMKPHGQEAGNLWGGKYDPTVYTSKLLDFMDSTMRLTASQAYDRLVRTRGIKASEADKRNFINQLGQYIKRGQNDIVAFFRDTGLGPFATAGTNYTVQGLRTLLGDTGLKAPNLKTAALLRAEFFARVAVPFIAAAVYNQLAHGRADGDENTPIGGLKLGKDKTGKTAYLDLGAMTGLPRGARTLGLLALLEGERTGAGHNAIAKRAVKDMAGAVTHPFEGPPVSLAYGAVTGENTGGFPVSEKAKAAQNQVLLNLQGALADANPVIATLSDAKKSTSAEEKVSKLFGPFGVKFRAKPPLAPEKK